MERPAGGPPPQEENAQSQLYSQIAQLTDEQQSLMSSLLSSLSIDVSA
ncbi:hypothetical protein [Colwellia sp. MEBiC06753]